MTAIMTATVPAPSARSTPAPRDWGHIASSDGANALRAARREDPAALAALEARVAHDLACLNYPPPDWVPPTPGPDGEPMLDVLVAGGGMCGQTVAYALRRDGIGRQRTIDARPEGLEGPWATFARMEMLRSPKHRRARAPCGSQAARDVTWPWLICRYRCRSLAAIRCPRQSR